MAISSVELQGVINRTQDIQQFQQFENEKAAIFHANQQTQVDQNVEEKLAQVHGKEDVDMDTETDDDSRRQQQQYGGDGGSNRRKKKIKDRIVEKSTMAFDVKI